MTDFTLPSPEFSTRITRLREAMAAERLDAFVVFHAIRVAYLTGFFHQITERPIVLVLAPDGWQAMLVPKLEQEHVAAIPGIDRAAAYPEYPTGGTVHPMEHLRALLSELGMTRAGLRIGFDHDGPLDMNGYRGAPFSEIVADGVETVEARHLVDRLRAVKSEAEIGLIAEASRWADRAHGIMQETMAVGRSDLEIAQAAAFRASQQLLETLGSGYQAPSRSFFQPWCGLPVALYMISGSGTALPHGLPGAIGLQPGDLIETFATVDIGGYQTELERTMIVGEPGAEIRRSFETMLQLQDLAFAAVRPGRALSEIEAEICAAFDALGVREAQRHHTGHGIGLEGHEAPFIDLGDPTVVEPGMVFTIEPGVYLPGFGGFRHSDTVVVREQGIERLTQYPRDLDDLVVAG
jgi:Xaa-Pro aminopeptidase